jgi:hypothetical protein
MVSIGGGLGAGPTADSPDKRDSFRGAFFWRPTGPGVIAYDDAGSVADPSGGTAVANLLANDWIAGQRATVATVALEQESASHAGVTLDPADGSVDVANCAPAGTHKLIYWICDRADASRCDDATANASLSLASVAPASGGATLDTSAGAVNVPTKTSSGAYVFTDRLGGAAAPDHCDTATVTLNLSGKSGS